MDIALVVSAAPLARRAYQFADVLAAFGSVHVVTTPAAATWVTPPDSPSSDTAGITSSPTGRLRPDLVLLVPATFNTVNKWACGINDHPAMGLLHDALGAGTPTLACPFVNADLATHPAWTRSLHTLLSCRIELLDPHDGTLTRQPTPLASGTGNQIADAFDPNWLTAWIRQHGAAPKN